MYRLDEFAGTDITVVQTSGRLQLNLRPTRQNKEGLKPLKKYKKKKTSGLTGCRAAATAAAAAAFIPALGYILGQQNIVHKNTDGYQKINERNPGYNPNHSGGSTPADAPSHITLHRTNLTNSQQN